MILFGLFGLTVLLSLYLASQNAWLYQTGIVKTTKRLSLKIINDALKKEIDLVLLKKIKYIKRVYIVYLLLFYLSIFLAILKIYMASND
ncbi:hypothetical protein BH09BAC6_BH09BAC6_10520 [soil metagenome]|jgi:hypothetical protein